MGNRSLLALDLDGTLIDTKDALDFSYRLALRELGVLIENLDFLKLGLSFNQICEKLGLQHQDRKKLRDLKDFYYFSNLNLTRVNRPVLGLVESLSDNFQIAVVTNSRRISAERVLEKHDLVKKIDYLVTRDDVNNPKPYPDSYLQLLKISGINASDTIAIEDSEIGKQAALAANITTLLIC
jgi:beta-phosphoglucomutase